MCAFFPAREAAATDVWLFGRRGEQPSDYKQILDGLQKGDTLVFAGGKFRFEFLGRIAHGNTTEVLRVAPLSPQSDVPEMALRVPIDTGGIDAGDNPLGMETPYVEFIGKFVRGSIPLKKNGVRIPAIYATVRNQFVAVELVTPTFTLESFIRNATDATDATLAQAETDLYHFLQSAVRFRNIGDCNPAQIVYDAGKKEWILLDFTEGHQEVSLIAGWWSPDILGLSKWVRYYQANDLIEGDLSRSLWLLASIKSIEERWGNMTTRLFAKCQHALSGLWESPVKVPAIP